MKDDNLARPWIRFKWGIDILFIGKQMFWEVLGQVFVPSSGLKENKIKDWCSFIPVVPYITYPAV